MKFTCALLACLILIGCGSRKYDNPGSDAQTYTEESFNEEMDSILDGKTALKSDLKLVRDISLSSGQIQRTYRIEQASRITTNDRALKYQKAMKSEIERIDQFIAKYSRSFRLRQKDGDLKLLSLTDEALSTLNKIRAAWQEALSKLETENKL